ncbi:transglutaminase domain-containing protein [Actinotalea sp. K2]|uniref:DUF3488 and transglutaminase-like domain-containing protein n=1 Tax=Actinotalea sp. K2 TaxID=2939438 RepID=UPI00201835F0|nr:transglutaminase domain-containing protein [Actinotalea sp. K2]MCL3863200.1 DUF3488 and transglutaminase-like domain-containing protein [Actinotalea sp. K2]
MSASLRKDTPLPTVDVSVLLGALVVALLPLWPVYGFRAVLVPIVGGLVLGAGLASVAARRAWPATVTAVLGIAVYLVAGGALVAPATTVGGVVPTLGSLTALLTGVVTVWKQVLTLDPSLGASGNLLTAPYLLAFAGSLGAVSIALRATPRRAGAWAALVPFAVLGLAVLLGTKESVRPLPAGTALAGGLLVWVAWRTGTFSPRRVVSFLAMGAVVVTGGVVGGPLLAEQHPRFVLRDELVPPFDPRDHASPLSAFRTFVKDWYDTDLLTVRGLPEGSTVRLATMDAFDGVVWNVAGSESAEGSGRFRRVGETITTSVRGTRAEVELVVHDLPMVWLPTVGYAERFDFEGSTAAELVADLRYNDSTGTAVLTGGVPAGTRWTVDVVVPTVPTDEEIGAATTGAVTLPEPRAVPDAVPLLAGEIAGSASTPVLVARSLETGLVERGWFSHGRPDTDDHPSLSGHGANRLTALLSDELMVGDGEQYASAMALMAREMGLPSRVVLGFVTDEEQAGAQELVVRGQDVQAWVEIAFTGHGWVPFHPTPDETKTPRDDVPQEQSEPQPQVMQPPPPPPDPVTPPDDDTEQARTEDTGQEPAAADGWRQVVLVAAAVGVPVLLLVGPFLLVVAAKRRRRRRRRAAGPAVARVVGGWDEVIDHARDLRRPPPVRATRRETAVELAEAFGPSGGRRRQVGTSSVGGAVAVLASGADAMVFGPGEPTPAQVESYWGQVDVAIAAMRGSVPRRHRWRARWATVSLRRRRSERRAAVRRGRSATAG